jgi:hypothetical protein
MALPQMLGKILLQRVASRIATGQAGQSPDMSGALPPLAVTDGANDPVFQNLIGMATNLGNIPLKSPRTDLLEVFTNGQTPFTQKFRGIETAGQKLQLATIEKLMGLFQ